MLFVVETPYSKDNEPGLQFVGQSEEIDVLNQRFVPLTLASLAVNTITDIDASEFLGHIGHWGRLDSVPNRHKATALSILNDSWQDNLGERRFMITQQGASGFLTSRQVSEEVALLGRLAGQPDFTWLTPQGYEADVFDGVIRPNTYAKPDLDAEEVEESPWTAELGPDDLEMAQRIGATHIARHYQVTFAPPSGIVYPPPTIENLRLRLGIEDEEGFQPLAMVKPA